MRRPALIPAAALVLALASCAEFPELDRAMSSRARSAPYPRLLPMQTLLAASPARSGEVAFATGALPARAASLRARARALRARPVIDTATRARLMAAVARHN